MKKMLLVVILLIINLCLTEILAQAEFDTGPVNASIGSYGRIRLYTTTSTDTVKHVERVSILVGAASDQVFDYQNDIDIEEDLILLPSSQVADYEIYGAFNNAYSSVPPDILQKLYIYGWNNESFILVKNTLINRESSAIDAIVGLDIIMEVDSSYGFDTVSYSSSNKIINTYRGGTHTGVKFLSHDLATLFSLNYYSGYYVDTSYWNWLNYNLIDEFFVADESGPLSIAAAAPVNVNPGDSIIFYYAIAVGAGESDMIANMNQAEGKYNSITSIKDHKNILPDKYTLHQNYPNPFNPVTNIVFSIPKTEFVTISVYNFLGELMAELINSELAPGVYTYELDASKLTSGTYFYSIKAGEFLEAKKMLLIK